MADLRDGLDRVGNSDNALDLGQYRMPVMPGQSFFGHFHRRGKDERPDAVPFFYEQLREKAIAATERKAFDFVDRAAGRKTRYRPIAAHSTAGRSYREC